jgi:hypothetical protein
MDTSHKVGGRWAFYMHSPFIYFATGSRGTPPVFQGGFICYKYMRTISAKGCRRMRPPTCPSSVSGTGVKGDILFGDPVGLRNPSYELVSLVAFVTLSQASVLEGLSYPVKGRPAPSFPDLNICLR